MTDHHEPAIVHSLAARYGLESMLKRHHHRYVWAAFMFVNGFITIAILAGLAMVSGTPSYIFPSLGPTAFLFFYSPLSAASSPRNAVYGHAIGILCGWGALWICGLQDAPPAMDAGVDPARVLAAALSLALTCAWMILARADHPPAAATTLIISLGLVTKPLHLAIIETAVALLTLQAIAINRLAGLDYPLWSGTPRPSEPP